MQNYLVREHGMRKYDVTGARFDLVRRGREVRARPVRRHEPGALPPDDRSERVVVPRVHSELAAVVLERVAEHDAGEQREGGCAAECGQKQRWSVQ